MIKSYAKLNLFLHVNGKTPNNYHLLDSLVAFTEDIYDEISAEPSDSYKLTITGKYSSQLLQQENLITKAVQLVTNFAGLEPNLHFTLNKQLPIAAGIGGGSGNAANAIKLAINILNIEIPKYELDKILLKIGADVPVCNYGKACYFNGIGEILTPVVKFPEIWAIFVNPNIHIDTPQIFKMGLQKYFKDQIQHPLSFSSSEELIHYLSSTQNDLYFNSVKLCPDLTRIIETIKNCNGCVLSRMSGSGATCFGLFPNENTVINAASFLEPIYPGYYIKTSKLI